MLSELNKLVRDVTEAYESYDVLGATAAGGGVCRQREQLVRAFEPAPLLDGDAAALGTLYEVLTTVIQLIAPATPFIADELYQNLVRNVMPAAPESVHLSRWPAANSALIDEQLSVDMALAQRVTSLGHAAAECESKGAPTAGPSRRAHAQCRGESKSQPIGESRARRTQRQGDRLRRRRRRSYRCRRLPLPETAGAEVRARPPAIRKLISGMDQLELAGKLQAARMSHRRPMALRNRFLEDVEVRQHTARRFQRGAGWRLSLSP
ncbi:MAG: class I tRNA ligase family protein [Caldilineaceae bacterium]